ncbi:hypothetical protein [Aquimarina sp. MMG016]|uniref:hypothetical protein n=1 Tax=Aquimarina sp. MMG016 TaxID=2822690 RepID=UPI001B3A6A8C|nr:hypothetical protein [Aquimarina sp. MMG016]MBQ4821299.1 hypothetical protein [Aquimarina sp. MMG016]
MKNLLLSFTLILSSITWSQDVNDVITLKNGSVIIGKITEFNYNQNLSIQTKDGYNFVFRAEDLKSVKKQQAESFQGNANSRTQNFRNSNQGYRAPQVSTQPNYQQVTPNNNFTSGTAVTPQQGNLGKSNNFQNMQANNANRQFANTPNHTNGNPNISNYQPSVTYGNAQQMHQANQNAPIPNQYNRQATNPNTYQYNANTADRYRQNPVENSYNANSNQLRDYNQNYDPNYNRNYSPNQLQSTSTGNPAQSNLRQPMQTQNPDIFTNIDNYGSINNNREFDCSKGFGNYGFINKTGKDIVVSLQRKQKDGVYGDYREISIIAGSKGYFNNIKSQNYPFFIKVKNSIGNNRNDFLILGRGKIQVEPCKTTFIEIK